MSDEIPVSADEAGGGEMEEVMDEATRAIQEQVKAMPEEVRRVGELIRRLMESCVTLSVSVAACDCEKKDNCKLYKIAREISKIILQIQEMRPPATRRAGRVGS